MATNKHNEILSQWQPSGFNWTSWHGIDLGVPSPTRDGETLGQSLQRVGNVLFTEVQQPGTSHADAAISKECADIQAAYGQVGQLFDTAVDRGLSIRSRVESPLATMMDTLNGRLGVNTTGETNPMYGSTTSVDYKGDDDESDDD